MRQRIIQGGYIGVLAVIIGTSVMLFLFVKVYLTPSTAVSELQPTNADGVIHATEYERKRATIDKVNTIADQQKERAEETNSMMDGI